MRIVQIRDVFVIETIHPGYWSIFSTVVFDLEAGGFEAAQG